MWNKSILGHFAAQECATEDGIPLDYDSRMLLQFCKTQMRLIDTYIAQEKYNSCPPDYAPPDSTDEVCIDRYSGTDSDLIMHAICF